MGRCVDSQGHAAHHGPSHTPHVPGKLSGNAKAVFTGIAGAHDGEGMTIRGEGSPDIEEGGRIGNFPKEGGIGGVGLEKDGSPFFPDEGQFLLYRIGRRCGSDRCGKAKADPLHLKERIGGCGKNRIRVFEPGKQPFEKEVADSRDPFQDQPWEEVVHNTHL